MKKARYAKYRSIVIIITMGFLTIAGIALVRHMFLEYNTLMLKNTDRQLISLVRSVDRNAESRLMRYMENLAHTVEHVECTTAEKMWMEEGNSEALTEVLEKSLLGQDETIKDLLVYYNEEKYLSRSGKSGYQIALYGKAEGDVQTGLCKDTNNQFTIIIMKKSESGASYAALINLEVFYGEITADLSDDLHNEIIMMDADAQTLVYRQGVDIRIGNIKDFSENDRKYNMLSFLISQQKKQEEGTDFCDAISSATGMAYTARMAVVPAMEDTNGLFTIGVSTDYDEIIRPLREGVLKMILYGGTAVLCVSSLVVLLLQTIRGNQKVLKEVAILQEKNLAMEELNRKTQEFAHHQRLELMGTLTSGIAHEFNNLLAPIMGYSILILEKLPPEETELYDEVLEIYNTSMKAKTVVSRLQDLARKNAGTDYQKFALDEIVRKTVEIAKPAKPKTVEIKMELKGEKTCVWGNETQISQLLLNLLINAFHATEKKGGIVSVRTEVREQTFLLQISDNGYGISEENIEKIFEPFFTTKKGGEGTGLGLAIAREVVGEHKGKILVESRENESTLFSIELPVFSEKD